MKEKKDIESDPNFVGTTLSEFVRYYNQNVPESFPRATIEALKEFQTAHPSLFDKSGKWTIDKHRKKLMDWLVSYENK